jgi:hypothetical protein
MSSEYYARFINNDKCDVDGCLENKFYAHFCRTHYYRYKKYGTPLGGTGKSFKQKPKGTTCSVDGCNEGHFSFGMCAHHYRKLHYKEKNKVSTLKYRLKKFGMTLSDYDALVKSQNGSCKICGGKSRNSDLLSLDHDHKTGKPRALLCDLCNTGLGAFKDNHNLLNKAIKYLKSFENKDL